MLSGLGREAPRIQYPGTQRALHRSRNLFVKNRQKTQERSHWLPLFFICIASLVTLADPISTVTVRVDPNEHGIYNRFVALDQFAQSNSSRLHQHQDVSRICRCRSVSVGHTQHIGRLHRRTTREGRRRRLHRSWTVRSTTRGNNTDPRQFHSDPANTS